MSGAIDSTTMRTKMQAIYKQLGIDPDSARACMMKARAARGGAGGRAGGGTAMRGTGMVAGGGGAQIVFVKQGPSWVPHRVRLGVSDFDYSQVLSGLQDGDVVALLGAAVMQAQRDQASDRAKAMTGGGLPGTGSTTSTRSGARGGSR
jgi:HlyD family secretion protein